MTWQIRCPNGHLLEIEDAHLGRTVRCPSCQIMMRAEAPGGPTGVTTAASPPPVPPASSKPMQVVDIVEGPPIAQRVDVAPPPIAQRVDGDEDLPTARRRNEDDYDERDDYDEPRRRSKPAKMKKATRMRLTRLGLSLHAAKILCYLIGILCIIIGLMVLVAAAGTAASSGTAATGFGIAGIALMIIFMLLWILAPVLGTIGSMLCMWVPKKTGAKYLIIISFALDAAGLLTYLACLFISLLMGAFAFQSATSGNTSSLAAMNAVGTLANIGALVSALMVFAAFVLFMLFLRQMLVYFNESGNADECSKVMFFCIGMGVFTPFYFAMAIGLAIGCAAIHPAISGVLLLFFILFWIVGWVNLLMKILTLIGNVRAHLSVWG
jgi:hypothetical protein